MVEPNDIKIWIEQNLPNSTVEIEGDGDTPIFPGDVIEVPERFF